MRVLREQRDLSSEEGKAALFTPLNTGSGAHGGVGCVLGTLKRHIWQEAGVTGENTD